MESISISVERYQALIESEVRANVAEEVMTAMNILITNEKAAKEEAAKQEKEAAENWRWYTQEIKKVADLKEQIIILKDIIAQNGLTLPEEVKSNA